MDLEIIVKLIIAVFLAYLIFVIAGALNSTFGIISAIMFILKAGYSIYTGEALTEPRVIMLLFGLSIISGVVGTILFDYFLPAIFRGEWVSAGFIIVIMIIVYFRFKERLMEAWHNRT